MTELHKNNQRVRNLIDTIKVLRKEVEVLTKRLRPAGTGHIITAIGVINGRIDEMIGELVNEQPDSGRAIASEIYGEELETVKKPIVLDDEDIFKKKYGRAVMTVDENDGFKEHTEAMEQSRLREIQDKASGRPNMTEKDREKFDSQPNEVRDAYLHSSKVKDEVEHTEEYYDTERNLPFNTLV